MKTFKYVTMLVALFAMAATFTSCDKDVDPDVDAKQNYWIEISLSNPGSLNATGQQTFSDLVEEVVYGGGKHYAMYCTEDYAKTNFQAVIQSMTASSDFATKVVQPTAAAGGASNFEFTITLSKQVGESMTQLDSHTFNAASLM